MSSVAPLPAGYLSAEALNDLIGLVYDSAFAEVPWQSLIDRITELFPGIGASLVGHDGEALDVAYVESVEGKATDTAASTDWFRRNRTSVTLNIQAAPPGFVARSTKMSTEEAWLASHVYRNHLAPNGFRHILHLTLGAQGRRGALIGIAIPEDSAAHDRIHDPLFALLKMLAPHAVRAFRLARALMVARRATEVFSGFLDGIILPILVTDASGTFLSGNAAGRRMIERGEPFRIADRSRLALRDADQTEALRRAIRASDAGHTQNGLRIETVGKPLLLAIMPFRPRLHRASAIDRDMLGEDRLFAIFVSQTSMDGVDPRLLEDVFRLTPREAEICQSLLRGRSAASIASAAGRSKKTVRNQIQVIYEKVGVTSNAALMEALTVFRTVGTLFEDDMAPRA